MPLPLTPLEIDSLSDAARKALSGPPPLKLMAARGLAPLPRPADVASVLYQLSLDPDETLKSSATKTAAELPDKIIAAALADQTLDPRVIDFFAHRLAKPALLEVIILNRATADETMRDLAGRCAERELDIIAGNEQRLLRHPPIIAALYMNAKARMSTVDRAVELAVRNNITVEGIPSWAEIVAAVLGIRTAQASGGLVEVSAVDMDAAFSEAAQFAIGDNADAAVAADSVESLEVTAAEGSEPASVVTTGEGGEKKKTPIEKLSIPSKIRLATLGNAFARAVLVRDSNKQVSMAAIRSPGITENEVIKFSANRSLADDVIRYIANTKEYTKIYAVKLNLVNNAKCPLAITMKFLPFLQDRDLKQIAKSKNIPQALAVQAKKLIAAKSAKSD